MTKPASDSFAVFDAIIASGDAALRRVLLSRVTNETSERSVMILYGSAPVSNTYCGFGGYGFANASGQGYGAGVGSYFGDGYDDVFSSHGSGYGEAAL